MAPAASGYAYGSLRRSAPEAVEAQEEEEDGWADEARVRRERRRDGRWRDEQRIFLGFAAPRSRLLFTSAQGGWEAPAAARLLAPTAAWSVSAGA